MKKRKKKDRKLLKSYQRKLEKRNIKKQFLEWSEKVKERDENKCVICDKTQSLNPHHIYPREIKELRFDIDNGITLCPFHHRFSLEISPHRNPFEFFMWFQRNRKEQFDKLVNKNSNI